jgi:hypothetical protein
MDEILMGLLNENSLEENALALGISRHLERYRNHNLIEDNIH